MTPQQALEIVKNIINGTIKSGLFQTMEDVKAATEAYGVLETEINKEVKK